MKYKNLIPLENIEKELFNHEELKHIDEKLLYRMAMRNMKKEREEKNLTQMDLSKISGITRSTISKIETGNRNVSIGKLIQIANAMNMNLEIRLIPKK